MDCNPRPSGGIWAPLTTGNGVYEVSDQGIVRKIRTGKIMTRRRNRSGYMRVQFKIDGKQRAFLVHRLVLEAFEGPCPEGREGCHWDGDKLNNDIENLYWGTKSENGHDRVRHGRHEQANKTQCAQGHEYSPENTIYRITGGRHCRECMRNWSRERQRMYRARARGELGEVG